MPPIFFHRWLRGGEGQSVPFTCDGFVVLFFVFFLQKALSSVLELSMWILFLVWEGMLVIFLS